MAKRENTELEKFAFAVVIGYIAGPGILALIIGVAALINSLF